MDRPTIKTGDQIGKLTVARHIKRAYACRCACGGVRLLSRREALSGNVLSCGCDEDAPVPRKGLRRIAFSAQQVRQMRQLAKLGYSTYELARDFNTSQPVAAFIANRPW